MKALDLLDLIGELDHDVLTRNMHYRKVKENTVKSAAFKRLIKWVSIAACFCLLTVGISLLAVQLWKGTPSPSGFVIEDNVLVAYTGIDKDVIIPDDVVCIANYAFKEGGNAEIVETVLLGKSVAKVEPYAFDSCTSLKSVSVSEKNNILLQENEAILSSDGTQLIYYNGKGGVYQLSESVIKVSAYAFANTLLTELILTEVTEIEDMAFYRNQMLKNISAPKVVSIGNSAFECCSALETVYFPSVQIIGESAFEFCKSLYRVNLPSVQQIGAFAFRSCDNLEVLQIPNVTTIGRYFIDGTNITALLIPNVTSDLNEMSFYVPKPELWGYSGSALEVFANQYGFSFVDITDAGLPSGFTPIKDYIVCGSQEAPLYKEPEVADKSFVRYLQSGSTVDRIAINDTWSLLDFNGERLYIENKYLKQFSYASPVDSTTIQTYGDFQYLEYEDHIRIYHYTGKSTDIVVPTVINGKPVTEMYYSLLSAEITSLHADSVEELILSSNEKTLLTLYRFHKLQKLSMPMLKTLPDNAFYECLVLTDVSIDSVERIGSTVFSCGTFTELYVPKANRIAVDALEKNEIRTLHGNVGSYAESWAKENGYGFVDIENDYIPVYGDLSVDPADLVYHPVAQSKIDEKVYGYQGVSIAHDRKGVLYLYVDGWDAYIQTPFQQYVNYAEDTVDLSSQTAAVCGEYVWLIAPNEAGSNGLKTLSVVRIDKNDNQVFGTLDLGESLSPTHLTCYFSDANNGKLIFSYFDGNVSYYLRVYETHDGGVSWTSVASDSLPHSIGGARMAEGYRTMGFVSDQIGFASLCYKFAEDPRSRTWLTLDGGKTWIQWNTTMKTLEKGYGETVELKFNGNSLQLTVHISGDGVDEPYDMIFISDDFGKTWTQQT